MKKEIEIIRVVADIHPDGDIYIKTKKDRFEYVGWITDDQIKQTYFPNHIYKKIKKIV